MTRNPPIRVRPKAGLWTGIVARSWSVTGPDGSACWWQVTFAPEAGKHYFYVRVAQADGNRLWSAPVWVEVQGQ